jgi:hypothetical protein
MRGFLVVKVVALPPLWRCVLVGLGGGLFGDILAKVSVLLSSITLRWSKHWLLLEGGDKWLVVLWVILLLLIGLFHGVVLSEIAVWGNLIELPFLALREGNLELESVEHAWGVASLCVQGLFIKLITHLVYLGLKDWDLLVVIMSCKGDWHSRFAVAHWQISEQERSAVLVSPLSDLFAYHVGLLLILSFTWEVEVLVLVSFSLLLQLIALILFQRRFRGVSKFLIKAKVLVCLLFPALGDLARDVYALNAEFLDLANLFLHPLTPTPLNFLLREPILVCGTTGTIHRHIQHQLASEINLAVNYRVHLVRLPIIEHGQLVGELLLRRHDLRGRWIILKLRLIHLLFCL